ncbi:unnamed protein product [Penicillium salamii]|uniref:Uncharacterized protein n=1 Tax=Penicillium salamii TaxID=1612424 RepID=A0A9W4J8A3_9EURO|nr:unnamed protein product [Penicillium salamii]CAG8128635.1 unnamed protein product [Penicillium salamii]CAG8219763.1 unnamed protein product [Penicillium salamii]CAG8324009.1 unnamed protein product [Penicillium salamii]CAG8373187.1 unnamed protein product [Penicillium salamii]
MMYVHRHENIVFFSFELRHCLRAGLSMARPCVSGPASGRRCWAGRCLAFDMVGFESISEALTGSIMGIVPFVLVI